MNILTLFITIAFVYLVSKFLKKKNYLRSLSGDVHQKFTTSESIPLIGGFFILMFFLIFSYDKNIFFIISIILMFSLGLLSDLKKIISAKKRMLFQWIIVIFSVFFLKLEINSTKVIILDQFLNNEIINIIFVSFCIMILVNGTNFIDGLNGLSLGYYFIVIIALLNNDISISNFLFNDQLFYLSIFLFILLVFNYLNLFFIGDNGAYILGLTMSFLLISIYKENSNISPFYIVLLLWYPCFELLFSIIRKFNLKFSPTKPDIYHLHQLTYYLIKSKFQLKKFESNNISSLLILLFNSIPIYLGSINIYNNQNQVLLIIFNIIFYMVVYNLLLKYKNKIS